MLFNQLDKRVKLNSWDIVRFQILTHCFLNGVSVSDADLNMLTLLARQGESELSSFCARAHSHKIFSNPQSVRNAIRKAELKGLIQKEGKNKKKISLNPQINLLNKGNILLDFKFLSVEAA